MPKKPLVEVGILDYRSTQVVCGLSDGSDQVHREAISTYDRATCFKPFEWANEKIYIELLEQYAKQCKQVQEAQK